MDDSCIRSKTAPFLFENGLVAKVGIMIFRVHEEKVIFICSSWCSVKKSAVMQLGSSTSILTLVREENCQYGELLKLKKSHYFPVKPKQNNTVNRKFPHRVR